MKRISLKRLFKRLTAAKTWSHPRTVWPLLTVVVLGLLLSKLIDRMFEQPNPRPLISIRHHAPIILTKPELVAYLTSQEVTTYSDVSDDPFLKTYSVFRFEIRNDSQVAVTNALTFHIDLGSRYARILDTCVVVKEPIRKVTTIRATYPHPRWCLPASDLPVLLAWTPDVRETYGNVHLYMSPYTDRGFGRVGSAPLTAGFATLMFAPSPKPLRFYFIADAGGFGREGHDGSVLLVNPLYQHYAPPRPLDVDNSNAVVSPPPTMLKDAAFEFAAGRSQVDLPEGLDARAHLVVHVIAKAPPGERLHLSVSIGGAVGIAYAELMAALPTRVPSEDMEDQMRIAALPFKSGALRMGNDVVVYWDLTGLTNYQKVRIFRSPLRSLCDMSKLGEEVFEGFGQTNVLEWWCDVPRLPQGSQPDPGSDDWARFLTHSPTAGVASVLGATLQMLRPTAPRSLQMLGYATCSESTAYFLDEGAASKSATYTLFAYAQPTIVSYPVIVNYVSHLWPTNERVVVVK